MRSLLSLLLLLLASTCIAVSSSSESFRLASYSPGDAVPISCLNRTLYVYTILYSFCAVLSSTGILWYGMLILSFIRESGEHVTDEHGILQYIPFLTCAETGRPLELKYLSEEPLNCTVKAISDDIFHLWEFYIHNDSPLACRVPARPQSGDRHITGDVGVEAGEWIPFGTILYIYIYMLIHIFLYHANGVLYVQ